MLTIRKAQRNDAALLSEMGYASYIHHFSHLWNERSELADYLQQEYSLQALQTSLQSDSCDWFIATDARPVGYAKVTWHAAVDENGPAGTLLHKLYLLPGETSKGAGEHIMAQLMQMARRRGETFFWLEVLSSNTQAQRFYTRHGFECFKDVQFSTPCQQTTLHILGKYLQQA